MLTLLASAGAAVLLHAAATAPHDPCGHLAPEIAHAAEEAGLRPETMRALVWTESRCTAVEGRLTDAAGPAQVRWSVWGGLLGPEGWREDELLGGWGVVAGGRVLGLLRERYRPASDDLLLCLYGVGGAALGFRRDCTYSRSVRQSEREAR